MPSITEHVRPILQDVIQSMAEVKTYWREKPRPYAGPGTFTSVGSVTPQAGIGGIQATIKINELVSGEGDDWVVAVPDSSRPSGWAFENRGTRILVVSLRVWSWTQQDGLHPHDFVDRVRTKLQVTDSPEIERLRANNIVWISSGPAVVLDREEGGRSLSEVNLDVRFRCSPEALARDGSIIEQVQMEGQYAGGYGPRLDAIVFTPPVNTKWTPAQAHSPLVWWTGVDGLVGPGKIWRDRINSYHLVPKGVGGVGDVVHYKDRVTSGSTSYLATDVPIPHDPLKSQYVWIYAQCTNTPFSRLVFLSFFLESLGTWFLQAYLSAGEFQCTLQAGDDLLYSTPFGDAFAIPPGRKVLVGAYIHEVTLEDGTIEKRARLDVDGISGPTVVFTAEKQRSILQVGALGGTNNGNGSWLSEIDVYDVGISEGEDLRTHILGYVKTRYK